MNFVQPIRDINTVKAIGEYLRDKGEKYYIMYYLGIYSGLRISDILKLTIRDIAGKKIVTVREKKTGKSKTFPINADLRPMIDKYCKDKKPWEPVVPNSQRPGKPVTRQYAYQIIHEAGQKFGLDDLGTHTLRKTFGYHFYQQTKDIALLMKILNHESQSKTLRYIGIEQKTINEAMRSFSVMKEYEPLQLPPGIV